MKSAGLWCKMQEHVLEKKYLYTNSIILKISQTLRLRGIWHSKLGFIEVLILTVFYFLIKNLLAIPYRLLPYWLIPYNDNWVDDGQIWRQKYNTFEQLLFKLLPPSRPLAFPSANSTKSSHAPPRELHLTSPDWFHTIVHNAATGSDLDAEEYQYIFYRTATVHQSHSPELTQ